MSADRKAPPPTMTLAQFAIATAGTLDGDVDAHIHAGLRSKPQTKTYQRWYDRRLAELQAARDATRSAYLAEIEAGRIRAPSALERLERTAAGHSDNPSVQAARRLLAKRARSALTAGEP